MTGNEANYTSQFLPKGHLHDVAPPPVDLVDFGGFEQSSNDEIDYVPVVSPLPELVNVNGFSLMNSSGSVTFPVDDSLESVFSLVDNSPKSVTHHVSDSLKSVIPLVDDSPQYDGFAFDISLAYASPPDILADCD
ncbi:hypothetical protein LguiA_015207 [Lonicera macranthoides]